MKVSIHYRLKVSQLRHKLHEASVAIEAVARGGIIMAGCAVLSSCVLVLHISAVQTLGAWFIQNTKSKNLD